MNQELTYWVALTHTPKIWTSRKNAMIVHCFNLGKTVVDFFESPDFLGMELTQDEVALLSQTKSDLGNYSFMVEELVEQGYDIIPITSNVYSRTLKSNLKYSSPLVLYTKGNTQLLNEQSVAIVGSRNANEKSLQFTDNIAHKASAESKVVVSGFAKGVDKQALDSALKYNGKSIIVLPQGISTFSSGMKKYYKPIVEGNVLVLSTFHPKSPWSVELAMARNSIIYGLASEIYAAQSDEKGGTWSGVCDGLKKGRKIYVRMPKQGEKCANGLLISKGAIAVDMTGQQVDFGSSANIQISSHLEADDTELRIMEILKNGNQYTAKEIAQRLGVENSRKISSILQKTDKVTTIDGKPKKYYIKTAQSVQQLSIAL